MAALEARHLANLTIAEVARGLRAVSSTYVERRHRIPQGAALSGAGKRAAFALFYGPLHYLLVSGIVRAIPGATDNVSTIVDLGCGTGPAGIAWAEGCRSLRKIVGIDRHPWVLTEAARAYRDFDLPGRTEQRDIVRAALPPGPASIIAAFAMNELPERGRDALLTRLIDRTSNVPRGGRLLIVEPLAGLVARWWSTWRDRFEAVGGRADEWRFRVELPPILDKLDRAAGLEHREISGRTLWLSTRAAARSASS